MTVDRARLEAIKKRSSHPIYAGKTDLHWLAERLEALVDAVRQTREYLDQRADIHHENPNAPNEEMRLRQELDNALLNL